MPELMNEISFGKLDDKGMRMPHLLDIQTRAFEALLQLDAASHDREDIGLERVFKDLFPITDVHENFSLEFVRYTLGDPKYTVEECIERDMTYSAPLKATLQLVINEEVNGVKRPRNIIEKEVYLGEWPDHRRGHRAARRSDDRGRAQGAHQEGQGEARARRERHARQGRRRADGGGLQSPAPPGHRDREGLRVLHDDRPARRDGRDR